MKEIIIEDRQAGKRLDKFLIKYLDKAGSSFIYKMLRKKNITINGKRASGSEKLKAGDVLTLYLSTETIEKFSGSEDSEYPITELNIIYEDSDVLLINKPAGMLTQKAEQTDVSLNEYSIGYLMAKGDLSPRDLKTCKPAVCNRLDRNTSGLVMVGKTITALQTLSEALKSRTLGKYYLCLAAGTIEEPMRLNGYLIKDEEKNQVLILKEPALGAALIQMEYEPLSTNGGMTLLRIRLITGKSHQIRAHLASVGHPVLGDYKYGGRNKNQYIKEKYGVTHQLLHASEIILPDKLSGLSHLAGRRFYAPPPEDFMQILSGEALRLE